MTKQFWSWFIVISLAASLAVIGSSLLSRQHLEADLANLAGQSAQLQSATARARDALAAANRVAAEQRAELQRLEATPTAAVSESSEETKPLDDGLILTLHPALRAKFEQSARHDLEDKYAALFRRWQLAPEKIEKLMGLMIHDAENALDLRGAAGAHGLQNYDSGVTQLRNRQFETLLSAEQAVLDPDQYQTLQRLQRIDGVRDGVDDLAENAFFTAPFSPGQIEQLTQVLAEASRDYQTGGRANWDTIDWNRALTQAASFLSEPQLAGVRNYSRFWQLAADHLPPIFQPIAPAK